MAKRFTAQRNILTLDEREDLEDDEKEEFSECESFFPYLIGQCRREGGKRVQGNDTGKSLGRIQIQARSHSPSIHVNAEHTVKLSLHVWGQI